MTQYLSMSEREGPCDGSHGRFCPECAQTLRWRRDALLREMQPFVVDEESIIASDTEPEGIFAEVDALTIDQWVARFPQEQREAVLTQAEFIWCEAGDLIGEVLVGHLRIPLDEIIARTRKDDGDE